MIRVPGKSTAASANCGSDKVKNLKDIFDFVQ
jgi:hypothetical protein